MMPPHLVEDESSFYDRLATDRRSIRSKKTYQSTSPPKGRDRTGTLKRSGKLPVFTEFTDSPQKDDDCSLLDIISEIDVPKRRETKGSKTTKNSNYKNLLGPTTTRSSYAYNKAGSLYNDQAALRFSPLGKVPATLQ